MKILSTLLAASTLVFGAQAVNAQVFNPSSGSYVFEGDVVVAKDMGEFTCKMTVNVGVASATSASVTASLAAGDWVCPLIGISGTGTATPIANDLVEINGLTISPPLSSGTCSGPFRVEVRDLTSTGTSPTQLVLSSPLSDIGASGGAACKLKGVLTQTSPASPQLQVD